jgi:2-dehydro-3-deoxyphosphogluconate aldolase / (4S)-4-hydroxy-2-oxoglutarate aldolase
MAGAPKVRAMSAPLAFDKLRSQGLISVIRAASTADALGAANAVAAGGIALIEITFTVPAAPSVIAELAGRDDLIVGAGTVITPEQAHDAIAAGARFVVAPNFSPDIAALTLDAGLMYCPGAYTPTEIIAAHRAGAHVIKVHPVGVAGGPDYIRVIRDPLPDIPMLAAGGTTMENLVPFLQAGCIGVGLGPALADPQLSAAGKFDEITKRAKKFLEKAASALGSPGEAAVSGGKSRRA